VVRVRPTARESPPNLIIPMASRWTESQHRFFVADLSSKHDSEDYCRGRGHHACRCGPESAVILTAPAARQQFNYPRSLAVDASGNVYGRRLQQTIRSGRSTAAGVGSRTLAGQAGCSRIIRWHRVRPHISIIPRVWQSMALETSMWADSEKPHDPENPRRPGVVTTFAGGGRGPAGSAGWAWAARAAVFRSLRGGDRCFRKMFYVADVGKWLRSGKSRRPGVVTTMATYGLPFWAAPQCRGGWTVPVTYMRWPVILALSVRVTPDGVTTLIGGTANSSGWTDGPGSSAQFNNPSGIASDSFPARFISRILTTTTIRIGSNPAITLQPASQSVDAGSAVSFYRGRQWDAGADIPVAEERGESQWGDRQYVHYPQSGGGGTPAANNGGGHEQRGARSRATRRC